MEKTFTPYIFIISEHLETKEADINKATGEKEHGYQMFNHYYKLENFPHRVSVYSNEPSPKPNGGSLCGVPKLSPAGHGYVFKKAKYDSDEYNNAEPWEGPKQASQLTSETVSLSEARQTRIAAMQLALQYFTAKGNQDFERADFQNLTKQFETVIMRADEDN
jgi:hypothetical protein